MKTDDLNPKNFASLAWRDTPKRERHNPAKHRPVRAARTDETNWPASFAMKVQGVLRACKWAGLALLAVCLFLLPPGTDDTLFQCCSCMFGSVADSTGSVALVANYRLLRLPEVLRRLGISRSTFYALPDKPCGVKLSHRTVCYLENEVDALVANRVRSRDSQTAAAMTTTNVPKLAPKAGMSREVSRG